MDSLMRLAEEAKAKQVEYLRLYEIDDIEQAKKVEMEYLTKRREVLEQIDNSIARQKSLPMKKIRERVEAMPKVKRIFTGIRSLDMELVSDEMKARGERGGMALGNFVQIAGSKGSGKSTFMMAILTGFTHAESVCWFDFEMGENRVVKKLKDFDYDENNMLYYGSSRDLDAVADEIKFLHATGVRHFVIDSAMKITVTGADRYDKFSAISARLSELTSSLHINIYLINQVSQSSEGEGRLNIKHGNDAEYDADFLFYLLKAPMTENGKVKRDEFDQPVIDESRRLLVCDKNRQDERLFKVVIPKSEIIQTAVEIEYTG